MYWSLSTVMMAVLTTNVFLIILSLALINKHILIRVGYRLLALFSLFTALRLVLPFALRSFTKTICIPDGFSKYIADFRNPNIVLSEHVSISLWMLFKYIWIAGTAVGVLIFLFREIRLRYQLVLCGKELTDNPYYRDILGRVCEETKCRNVFRIIEMPGMDTPCIYGIIRPKILLPEHLELSEEQLALVFKHEVSHHKKHDMVLKCAILFLAILYWWDPFVWLLRSQTDTILEMRIDDSVIEKSELTKKEYMSCLISVVEQSVSDKRLPNSHMIGFFKFRSNAELKERLLLMLYKSSKPHLAVNISLLALFMAVFLFSYQFIFEGFYTNEELFAAELNSNTAFLNPYAINSFLIDNVDGTYDYYMDDFFVETLDSLQFCLPGTPIYTRENCPYPLESAE